MSQLRSLFLVVAALSLLGLAACVNRPPTLNCLAEQATVTEGDSVTIQSNAVDPDKKDRLTFDWSADQGRLTAQEDKAVFDSTGLSPGKYTVKAEVRDKKQHTANCSVEVNVEKHKLAPTATCRGGSQRITEGGSVTLRAQASDPNGDALTFGWTVDGRSVTSQQSSLVFGTQGRSLGSHSVRFTATDVDGMKADCGFTVTIDRRPNKNPSVALTLDHSEVLAGQAVNASARGSDPDNDPLTYSWNVDRQSRAQTASSLQINTGGMAGGRHSVSVTVRDDRGATATDTKSFSVREKMIVQMNGYRVDNVAKAALDEIALKLQQNPQLRAELTGHTDDRGSEKGNLRAGEKRAQAVKDYLVKQQVSEERIEVKSAGESQPIADNKTREGRKENRRVEIELYVP
ncbi:MAG: PKD domain-containing protein [Acidobacteriota bacterium]